MKNTLLLLSAACCLALPVAGHADDLGNASVKTAKAAAKAGLTAATVSRSRMICYITDRPRTGSHIPMTYRQYNGRIDSACNPAVYGLDSLRLAGIDDTAAILTKLDPDITSRR